MRRTPFIQVLEGEERTVKTLGTRIKADPRHRNVTVLFEGKADARAFGDWQMGFKRLDPDRPEDQSVFRFTRSALERRVSTNDGRLMLETALVFAGADFLAETA